MMRLAPKAQHSPAAWGIAEEIQIVQSSAVLGAIDPWGDAQASDETAPLAPKQIQYRRGGGGARSTPHFAQPRSFINGLCQ
jgi:hypothetical protein